ncbi:hypothetical protein EVJ58_g1294 [Rhodofomes roseus]|uniref:FAD-binding domain-containing protein n=1 Tax=Rhodofomes roseus TaxID=34475 RepID=A0A4Y9YZJ4_9APHY|nr:hypothetical protein EVJ58_g1294 [Rhodofomes roseus]
MDRRLRVAIIGGGIGGVALAVSLHKLAANVAVDIYEAAPSFPDIGAGVMLWRRTWEIIQALGLADELSVFASGRIEDGGHTMHMRKSDEKEAPTTEMVQSGGMAFHRSHLLASLRKHIPDSCSIHFAKRLQTYTRSLTGDIQVTFADGTQATHDLVVGCDGVNSAVRGVLYGTFAEEAKNAGESSKAAEYASKVDPVWSETVVYRGLAPRAVLEKTVPDHPAFSRNALLLGKDKHIILYPIAQGKLINVVALVSRQASEGTKYGKSWIREATNEEVLREYAGWEPLAIETLAAMERTDLWAINVVPTLPTYIGDGVALVGDAAHAMATHLGAGAGQAIEDAFVLASLLAHPAVTDEILPHALRAYDEVRRPFSQWVADRSRECGLTEEFNVLPQTSDPVLDLQEVVKRMRELFSFLKETSAMADRHKAVAMLEAAVGK